MCEIWEEDFIATAPMWTVVGLEQVVVELSSSSSSSSISKSKQASKCCVAQAGHVISRKKEKTFDNFLQQQN
jgi:hypothetical protein